MANWAYVENNQIQELHDNLPTCWKHISGLSSSIEDLDFLNSLGWIKVTKNHQEFNTELYQIDGYNYEIVDNSVVESYKLIDKIVDVDQIKKISLERLREERNQLLKESDWTQFPDVQSQLGSEMRVKWLKYRKQLRDLPKIYENIEFNIEEVNWPKV